MHFALQREMAGLKNGMVTVGVLNGPINSDYCLRVMMFDSEEMFESEYECLGK